MKKTILIFTLCSIFGLAARATPLDAGAVSFFSAIQGDWIQKDASGSLSLNIARQPSADGTSEDWNFLGETEIGIMQGVWILQFRIRGLDLFKLGGEEFDQELPVKVIEASADQLSLQEMPDPQTCLLESFHYEGASLVWRIEQCQIQPDGSAKSTGSVMTEYNLTRE